MNRIFYCNHITDGSFLIENEDHRHAIKVLRLKRNDSIDIIDGSGHLYRCVISDISKRNLTATIRSKTKKPPLPYRLGIAISPLKNASRLEWFLEKSVEIGITDIYPIICQRTEKPTIKYSRAQKIIQAAMKQSLNIYEPRLHPLRKVDELISLEDWDYRYIAYINENVSKTLSQSIQGENILITIGPEGGFTPQEAAFLISRDFKPVSLGTSRLRTETGGIVACQIVKSYYERSKID